MIHALQLLHVARDLERKSQEVGYPGKQAALRRAISTAYYALFHHMVARGIGRLGIGQEPLQRAMRAAVARWPDHARVKALSHRFVSRHEKTTLPSSAQSNPAWPAPSPELIRGAKSFVDLYDQRQRADYDLASPVTPQDARQAIVRATDGMVWFDQALLKLKPPDLWASWFFLLLMSEPKQRA